MPTVLTVSPISLDERSRSTSREMQRLLVWTLMLWMLRCAAQPQAACPMSAPDLERSQVPARTQQSDERRSKVPLIMLLAFIPTALSSSPSARSCSTLSHSPSLALTPALALADLDHSHPFLTSTSDRAGSDGAGTASAFTVPIGQARQQGRCGRARKQRCILDRVHMQCASQSAPLRPLLPARRRFQTRGQHTSRRSE